MKHDEATGVVGMNRHLWHCLAHCDQSSLPSDWVLPWSIRPSVPARFPEPLSAHCAHRTHLRVCYLSVAEMQPCLLPRASLCNLFGVHVSKLLKSACELLTLHVPVGVAEKAKHSNFFSMACQICQICQIASWDGLPMS